MGILVPYTHSITNHTEKCKRFLYCFFDTLSFDQLSTKISLTTCKGMILLKTHHLLFDWKLEAHEDLSVMTNQEGQVAITTTTDSFGDPQVLLFCLSETEARFRSLPHYIVAVHVSTDKVIKIEMTPFFDQQIEEQLPENL